MELKSFISDLSELKRRGTVEYSLDYPFSRICTLRMGGDIPCLIYPKSEDAFIEVIRICSDNSLKYRVIGNASNIIPPDKVGIPVIISSRRMKGIYRRNEHRLRVYAGEQINSLIVYCMKNSMSGMEMLYGIPATVGGAAVMNAGAFGESISDSIYNIRCYDTELCRTVDISNSDASYSYRKSIFTDSKRYIILCVDLEFSYDSGVRERAETAKRNKYRTQPTSERSAGSVFRKSEFYPPPAYLIDRAGLKGFTIGDAAISEKHAGFMINRGNAKEADFRKLIEYTRRVVSERFSAELICETEFLGDNNI